MDALATLRATAWMMTVHCALMWLRLARATFAIALCLSLKSVVFAMPTVSLLHRKSAVRVLYPVDALRELLGVNAHSHVTRDILSLATSNSLVRMVCGRDSAVFARMWMRA